MFKNLKQFKLCIGLIAYQPISHFIQTAQAKKTLPEQSKLKRNESSDDGLLNYFVSTLPKTNLVASKESKESKEFFTPQSSPNRSKHQSPITQKPLPKNSSWVDVAQEMPRVY